MEREARFCPITFVLINRTKRIRALSLYRKSCTDSPFSFAEEKRKNLCSLLRKSRERDSACSSFIFGENWKNLFSENIACNMFVDDQRSLTMNVRRQHVDEHASTKNIRRRQPFLDDKSSTTTMVCCRRMLANDECSFSTNVRREWTYY